MNKREIKKHSIDTVLNWAKQVIASYYSCETNKIKYIGGGYFGYVYYAEISKVPYKVVIKACLSPNMHEDEARNLKLIGDSCPVPVPNVYFTYSSTQNIPMDFICMEYMQGKDVASAFNPLKLAFVSNERKQKFTNEIINAMGVWHNKKNDKFGLTENAVYDNWFDYYKPFARDILETAKQHKDLFPASVIEIMDEAWKNFDKIFYEKVENAVLVHGDLNVINIMCDSKLNATAIIDPLESKWADKEFDLFQLKNSTGEYFGLYNAYKAKYKVSKMVDAKCAFYGLFNEVYCNILADKKLTAFNLYVKWIKKELKKL